MRYIQADKNIDPLKLTLWLDWKIGGDMSRRGARPEGRGGLGAIRGLRGHLPTLKLRQAGRAAPTVPWPCEPGSRFTEALLRDRGTLAVTL